MNEFDSLVSVIIPVYNADETIEKCLKSVCSQSYGNLEIIVVNDGSNDGSESICRQLQKEDSRIKLICVSNGGVSHARNTGIEIAAGSFCCFVDADDWIEANHIFNMVQGIQHYDCLIEGFRRDDGTKYENHILEENVYSIGNVSSPEFDRIFIDGYIHPCWNKLFRTRIIKKHSIRFPENISLSEDSFFCVEYLKHCNKVCTISSCGYHYCRVNGKSSLSRKVYPNSIEVYGMLYDALDGFFKYWGGYGKDHTEAILLKVCYPQIFGVLKKSVLNPTLTKEEKKLIWRSALETAYSRKVLIAAYHMADTRVEKVLLFIINNNLYTLFSKSIKMIENYSSYGYHHEKKE